MSDEQLSLDEAIARIRADPSLGGLVHDAYLGRDVADSQRRFAASAEFAAVMSMVRDVLLGATVVDLGAGVGIASAAFAWAGAGRVIAVEPDGSDEVGRGAIGRGAASFEVVAAFGEELPFPDGSIDLVYARQVLHHAQDLDRLVAEVARVLRAGGLFLACREHVVDDDRQLEIFLANHPVHRLAGGEHAYPLKRYVDAFDAAGLVDLHVLGPWDSVINAFPAVRTEEERRRQPAERLGRRLGVMGQILARVPVVERRVWRRIDRAEPGRLYTFLGRKA